MMDFINDLDAGLQGMLSRFTDDMTLGGAVDFIEGREASTNESWANTNCVNFSWGYCWILHLGMKSWKAAPGQGTWGSWSMES